jgi:S-adenosylmethionine hydrolase
VLLRSGERRLFVGPDNGLLVRAAERAGGIVEARHLTNAAYWLEPLSHTFHARDVFAPAAAHLAAGVAPDELGPSIDAATLVRLDVPEPAVNRARARATVLYVDRFGNMQLNMDREDLERMGVSPGDRLEIEVSVERYFAQAARTFADARAGDIVLYEDAYGNMAIAINGGNAASMFDARPGAQVRIRLTR